VVGTLRFEALTSAHVRHLFTCGVPPLDRYFRDLVTQDIRRGIASCFVACAQDGAVAGFYTLAAAQIGIERLPDAISKRLPRYPTVPAVRIGRLAVDTAWRGKGLGALLLIDATGRVIRSEIAAFALLVDAKDDEAATFYGHYGFMPLAETPRTLFLPIDTSRRLPR
jgi:GNAT superfamily N-acetyltransferase